MHQRDVDKKRPALRDGERMRFTMSMMDHLQRETYLSQLKVVDATGQPAGSRPGYCFAASVADGVVAARDEAMAAYDEYVAQLGNAYRGGAQ